MTCAGHGYYKPIVHAVALYAKNERELLELEQRLTEAKIRHHAVREPDAPWFGQLMAIGIYPQDRNNYHQLTRKFQLVK